MSTDELLRAIKLMEDAGRRTVPVPISVLRDLIDKATKKD
jgi:hypothetical protein